MTICADGRSSRTDLGKPFPKYCRDIMKTIVNLLRSFGAARNVTVYCIQRKLLWFDWSFL